MYEIEEHSTINNMSKKTLIMISTFKYIIGIAMAYWGSKIFSTLGYTYRKGLGDNLSGINCLQCPTLLKESGLILIIFGIILIALYFIIDHQNKDYIPAGLIWILAGTYYLWPETHNYKGLVLTIYFVLFVLWIIARIKSPTNLIGYIQIFMPLALVGVIFTDDITVWLFSIFLSISFEGLYLAIQGASEIAFWILSSAEKEIREENAIQFLKHLTNILNLQKAILWGLLSWTIIDVIGFFGKIQMVTLLTKYVYIACGLLYLITWILIGIYMYKVNSAMGIAIFLSITILLISIIIKYTLGNTYLSIIGILTGISIISQIGPIYEYAVRKYTSAIMFNIYVDHTSIVLMFTLLGIVLYSKNAIDIMVSVAPFLLAIISVVVKLFAIALVLDALTRVLNNIEYALKPSQ